MASLLSKSIASKVSKAQAEIEAQAFLEVKKLKRFGIPLGDCQDRDEIVKLY